jgi:hypothetical protein
MTKVVVDESGDIAVVTIKTAGVNGAGVATGGTVGSLLAKDSSATYDTSWTQFENGQDGDQLIWNDSQQYWENRAPAARSATVAEPQTGDNFTLFKATRSTTLRDVSAIVSGGSVTYEIRYSTDRSASGTLAIVADTVTNTTSGATATLQNQPIPVDSWVWLEITAVSGTVEELNVSVAF